MRRGDDNGGGGGENVRPDDRRHRPADRRPGRFGPPGQKAADLAVSADQQGDQRPASTRPSKSHTRTTRPTRRPRSRRPASWSTRRRELHRRRLGVGGHDPDRASRSRSARGSCRSRRPRRADEITDLDDDGLVNRTSPPDTLQGPALADPSTRRSAARRARRSTSAPATTPTAAACAERSPRPGRRRAARSAEKVLYDPEQPSYNSEAQKITSGNPDAFVIVDFPETFAKVGPALVANGQVGSEEDVHHRRPRLQRRCPRTSARRRPRACAAPRRARPTRARRRRRSTSCTRVGPEDVERQTFDAQNFDAVDALLPGGGRGGVDGRRGHGGRARGRERPARARSTRSSSCPRRSRRCRTARTSTTRARPGAIDLDDARRPDGGRLRHLRVQERQARTVDEIGETPLREPASSREAEASRRLASGRAAGATRPGRFQFCALVSRRRSMPAVPPR